NVNQTADAGACGAVVTYPAATATDNCLVSSYSYSQNSGTFFPVGTTTVTVTATDNHGNVSLPCTFTVTVNDNEKPIVSCPSNVNQTADAGACGAVVTYPAATATDNCLVSSYSYSQNSGTFFPVGTTTVTVTATDNHGNVSLPCTFTVTVNDNELPIVTCPSNVNQTADAGACGAVVTYPAATATDNCLVSSYSYSQNSGTFFPVGTTTVTVTATDNHGNVSLPCTFTVTVNDNELPIVTCPSNVNQTADAGACGAVVTYPAATATDNCLVSSYSYSQNSGTFFPVGTTTVTVTATDNHGNVSLPCTFTVTVNDNELPIVTCPSNVNQTADAGACGAVVTYPAATATDNCLVSSYSYSQNSGTFFPVGTTTVTVTATDNHGNVSLPCTFTVTVNDNEKPIVSCPSNVNQTADAGACGAVVTYPAATATDNCLVSSYSYSQNSGTFFPVGTTTVTVTATDNHGNVSLPCTFTVTVNDNEKPIVSCPSNVNQTADAGACGAVVTYPAATATDNCLVSSYSYSQNSGTFFPVGTTTVTVTATDNHGNVSLPCTFTVTVNDNELPIVTCPSNVNQTADAGACGAVVTYPAATATDN